MNKPCVASTVVWCQQSFGEMKKKLSNTLKMHQISVWGKNIYSGYVEGYGLSNVLGMKGRHVV